MALNKVVALVPMRHHSVRVPGKNYRPLAGKPLYQHIIASLLACPEIHEIVVDTDSEVVIDGIRRQFPRVHVLLRPEIWAAREYGADAFLRRAGDPARKAVFRHMLTEGVAPNAEAMKQPLVPELASMAGMIGQLRRILS